MDTPAQYNPPQPAKKAPSKRGAVLANLGVLLLAPLFAILLTTFVFQSYQVDGHSMQNTLQDADRLIVWKGSSTWAHIFGNEYIPGRGDIVVVRQDNLVACGQSDSKVIVKRVIGLPGDHVVYRDGAYTIYNTDHPHGFNPDTTLPYGESNTGLLNGSSANSVNVTLGPTQLFISGDHRSNSCDSRYFGPIQANQIIGKVVARVYPVGDAEKF